jgi:tRNA(fMet)-specific endonuclease VapC
VVFLLDTNIISDVAHNPNGLVGKKIKEIDPALVVSSVIVAGEIWYGVENNPSFKSRSRTESFMETLQILPLQPEVGRIYGSIRAHLKRTGGELSANDLLIAAHALSLDATLVTGDERAFSRVPGLKIENWLRR